MTELGLRERKKQRTRTQIADAAARLFAEHGYEQVSVLDVAAAAEVSEQTVYNHFATKQDLVLDRDEQLRERLAGAVRERAAGSSPGAAVRPVALELVGALRAMDAQQVRGGLGYLALRSPALRRLSLEMTDRHADAIADVLAAEPGGPSPALAKARAMAIAWVIQAITDESGRATAAGVGPAKIADALEPLVDELIADL